MHTPQISVIICTYNRAALLARTLLAFRDQTHPPSAEILVIDNNSNDDTAEVSQRCTEDLRFLLPVTYVYEPTQGLSRARNAGIAVARGDILAFLDDDAVPSPGWLAAIAEVFATHPDAAAAGGPVEPEFEAPRPDWLGPGLEGYYSILDLGPDTKVFPRNRLPFGASMALRRGYLGKLRFSEKLGRKGTSLASGEEFALLAKIGAKNRRIYYAPGMRVRHFIAKERLRLDWLMARSRAGGMSLAVSATGPVQRAQCVLRTVADDAYWRARQALGIGCDPVLQACREAQCRGVYSSFFPPRKPDDSENSGAERGYDC